jgi:hypothetical protein
VEQKRRSWAILNDTRQIAQKMRADPENAIVLLALRGPLKGKHRHLPFDSRLPKESEWTAILATSTVQ